MKLGLFFPKKTTDFNKAAASHWIRVLQMEKYYKELGIEVYINKPFKTYDFAIFFRKPKPKYYRFMQYLRFISRNIYFDTCINIFDEHEEINSKRLEAAHKIAAICDGIICASDKIAEKAAPHAKSVFVMDDPVDFEHFNKVKEKINFDNPIFGWSGVPHKAIYLNKYKEVIDGRTRLITKDYIKDVPLEFKYEFIDWDYNSFPEALLKCDIGFLPRDIDEAYNSGHSSHKALVFASLGIPVIANKIPSYVKLAGYYDGIVFLEDFNDDVEACINELKKRDPDISRLKNYYSCENQASRMLDYLTSRIRCCS
ncbi:hypothetical protein [Saccharicrinis sp. FJH54]|uniref:hypothetical protein n=1 Tax=Saccharicrinis sp. FJH54 TaxID=3344665 RepID=UPI0035D4887E